MKKADFTEAQILAVIIQIFCSSFMFMSLWGMYGFLVAGLSVIWVIFFLKPSLDRRKKIRSIPGCSKLDNLDSQRRHKILLLLLLFGNAVLGPVISAMPIGIAGVSSFYLMTVGLLFYVVWKKLALLIPLQ